MNKKAYITPAVQMTIITPSVMIAGSILSTSGADGVGVGGNSEDEGITSGNTKSNDWDIWDE